MNAKWPTRRSSAEKTPLNANSWQCPSSQAFSVVAAITAAEAISSRGYLVSPRIRRRREPSADVRRKRPTATSQSAGGKIGGAARARSACALSLLAAAAFPAPGRRQANGVALFLGSSPVKPRRHAAHLTALCSADCSRINFQWGGCPPGRTQRGDAILSPE